MLATGLTRDKRAAPVHRRRHQQRDRARQRASACSPPRRPPAPPSRRRRSAAGCAPPRARSRACGSRDDELELQVIGDAEPVGLCGSGLVDCVAELVAGRAARPLGALRPDEDAARSPARAADEDRRGARLHARRRRLPLPARRARAAVRQGLDRHRLEDPAARATASRPRTSSRCCWPAASAPTSRPPARCGSGSCRGWRCRASSRPATSPARARRWSRSAVRERAEARSIVREVEYVELSGRADFNDLFIDQLAFPG